MKKTKAQTKGKEQIPHKWTLLPHQKLILILQTPYGKGFLGFVRPLYGRDSDKSEQGNSRD